MKVYGVWHGGHSYRPGTVEDDTEEFDSMSDAKEVCESRYKNWHGDTPAVDETSGMALYFEDPRETHDPIPDRLIAMGKRGGWRFI
jgi:hypothetical protein